MCDCPVDANASLEVSLSQDLLDAFNAICGSCCLDSQLVASALLSDAVCKFVSQSASACYVPSVSPSVSELEGFVNAVRRTVARGNEEVKLTIEDSLRHVREDLSADLEDRIRAVVESSVVSAAKGLRDDSVKTVARETGTLSETTGMRV